MLYTLGYVDPMSGAIILQLIAAGVVGAAAFFHRSIWKAVRAILRIKGPQEDEADAEEAPPSEAASAPSAPEQEEASERHGS